MSHQYKHQYIRAKKPTAARMDANMCYVSLAAIVLGGCVGGTSYEPCPEVVVYLTFADSVLVTDSIDYAPTCRSVQ